MSQNELEFVYGSSLCYGTNQGFDVNPRFIKLRKAAESVRVKNADLHVKIQMQLKICSFTLIFAIDIITAVLNHFLKSRIFM